MMKTDVEASGLVMLGVCSVKGPSCTAPVTAAPITVVVEVETKNQIPVCRACFKERVSDGNWHPSWTGKAMVDHREAATLRAIHETHGREREELKASTDRIFADLDAALEKKP
jgi:hypothetical protein